MGKQVATISNTMKAIKIMKNPRKIKQETNTKNEQPYKFKTKQDNQTQHRDQCNRKPSALEKKHGEKNTPDFVRAGPSCYACVDNDTDNDNDTDMCCQQWQKPRGSHSLIA